MSSGIPNRINGKVSGIVNGLEFSEWDLQSYVVTTDGRTYTAVSKLPEEIGFDMQTLNILGGLISWLFAKPVGKAKNGYQRTGENAHGKYNICMFNKIYIYKNENLVLRNKLVMITFYSSDFPRLSNSLFLHKLLVICTFTTAFDNMLNSLTVQRIFIFQLKLLVETKLV